LQNPTHLYTSQGAYTVKLTVTNVDGCIDSLTKINFIHIYGPIAKFDALPLAGCKPLNVIFSDSSITDGIHPITNWLWNFGDGSSQNFTAPPFSHLYDTSGNFISQLIITDNYGCTDSFTISTPVTVTAPVAAFNSTDTFVCIGSNVIFNNTSSGINLVYAWTLGNGITSTQQNPTTTYSADGSYTIKLLVTDSLGCKDSSQLAGYINVQTVKAGFTIDDSVSACPPLNVSFTNTSVNDTSFVWNFGDGTSSDSINPAHSYSVAGTYIATLIATGPGGCVDSAKRTIWLLSSAATLTYSPIQGCSQISVSFHIAAAGQATYFWDFNDGDTISSTLADITHNYTSPGSYLPKVIVTNPGGCQVPVTGSDTIHVTKSYVNFIAADSTTCLGTAVAFTDSTTGNASIAAWRWNFGDGDTSALQNPTHLYTSQGAYTVKLTVTNVDGCIDSLTKINFIHIYGPIAKFDALPLAGCKPLNVIFSDSSITDGIHPITNWLWNFGDGSSQNFTAPPFSHLYDTSGNFISQLIITDNYGCTDSFTISTPVTVTAPVAAFNSTDTFVCIGSNVIFNNTSSGINLVYAWTLGNGITSTQQNPTTTYSADGSYTIKLLVTDSLGCKDSSQLAGYINVQTVKAGFTIDDSVSACPPLNVSFTNTSVNDTSFVWNFGDGTSSDSINPAHSYSVAGTYIATLIATGPGGCVDSAKRTIWLLSSAATLTYSPIQGCSQISVSFHIAAAGQATYFWDFNDGDTISSTLADITHNYTSPGSYLPKVIVTNPGGCQVPVTGSDTIHVTKSYVNFIAADSTTCLGTAVAFTDSTTGNASIAAWRWNFGDGDTSALQNPTHLYTSQGAYTVKLTVTNVDGCKDSLTKPGYIKINASPDAGIIGDTSSCVPASLTFSGNLLQADTSILTWQWHFGNGNTSDLENPLAQQYNAAGSFPLQLIVSATNGCNDTINKTILIHPLPTTDAGSYAAVCMNAPLQLQATGADSYTWSPSTYLSCTNCANPVATPADTISYFVTGSTIYGCQTTDSVFININKKFILTVTPTSDSICTGQSVQLTASGADNYIWTPATGLNNPLSDNPVASPDSTVIYKVVGHDNSNCFSDSANVNITVFPYPTVIAGTPKNILQGETVTLTPQYSSDIATWMWAPPDGLSCINCADPIASPGSATTYTITVTNLIGCSSTDTISVNVLLPCEGTVYIPSAFTPNGDGKNDVFYPLGNNIAVVKSMLIFDRFGEKIFERLNFAANDASQGWDGTYKGQQSNIGSYVYIIEVECDNNIISTFKGNVTLIR